MNDSTNETLIAMESPEAVIARVRDEISRRGMSQTQVAREAGISQSSLTQLLGGTYAANPRKMTVRLAQWLARLSQQRALPVMPQAPGWVSTPTAERILAALAYAHMAGDVAVIYGGAGVGKTTAAREYAARFPNIWIATMTPATAGVTTALEEVCLALGFRELPGGGARMQRELVARLQGSEGLLVIDEAQHLGVAALDALRALHDATGIGLALMGNELIYARMTGGTRAVWLDRLFSRIGRRLRVQRVVRDDVAALAAAHGVEEAAALRRLMEIGGQAGALRAVGKTLRLARMMAAGQGTELGADHIAAAWADLTGGAA